jgi:hypothetical protein
MSTAPPIGLMPKKIYAEQVRETRILDILQAMRRYAEAQKPAPIAWIDELQELLTSEPTK